MSIEATTNNTVLDSYLITLAPGSWSAFAGGTLLALAKLQVCA